MAFFPADESTGNLDFEAVLRMVNPARAVAHHLRLEDRDAATGPSARAAMGDPFFEL